ncbi:uncharacterized protein V6R79_023989 [Siganus canaliculatus]
MRSDSFSGALKSCCSDYDVSDIHRYMWASEETMTRCETLFTPRGPLQVSILRRLMSRPLTADNNTPFSPQLLNTTPGGRGSCQVTFPAEFPVAEVMKQFPVSAESADAS